MVKVQDIPLIGGGANELPTLVLSQWEPMDSQGMGWKLHHPLEDFPRYPLCGAGALSPAMPPGSRTPAPEPPGGGPDLWWNLHYLPEYLLKLFLGWDF
ncbi:uncharacterized protein BDV14DRAFT_206556 [Aspergillus stella-maris]|uniref:uncharacterized protein n=1 Tax=Aspergillus stella-maris TaxID=1810926 RepID=UPI003CCE002D